VASTLGHFDWTFDDPLFRTILLHGIAWTAGESPYRFDSLIARRLQSDWKSQGYALRELIHLITTSELLRQT
jgi:type 1 glutamine amidotransferase